MTKQSDQERIKKIFQMLFEMATGNMAFRLNDSNNDELKNIAVELNEIAEELPKIMKEFGYINPYYAYQNLIQLIFVLDDKFTLVGFNNEVPHTLKYKSGTIKGADFGKLIAGQSKNIWDTIRNESAKNPAYQTALQLIFMTGDHHLMPSFCTVSKLLGQDTMIISSVATILDNMLDANQQLSSTKIRRQLDTNAVQNLHTYILNHLDEPLPSLPEIARMFTTEEHILKTGFRECYNSSIYNFYHEARLKRAHQMIQQTNIGLKQIAFMNGFKSYLNFYKAFKKRFGYAPSDLARSEQE